MMGLNGVNFSILNRHFLQMSHILEPKLLSAWCYDVQCFALLSLTRLRR